jgi:hypothetical protein
MQTPVKLICEWCNTKNVKTRKIKMLMIQQRQRWHKEIFSSVNVCFLRFMRNFACSSSAIESQIVEVGKIHKSRNLHQKINQEICIKKSIFESILNR